MSGALALLMAAGSLQQVAFIDAGTGGYEAPVSGTLQVPYPATVAAGNFLVAHIVAQDGSAAITGPAGWTLIGSNSSVGATLSNLYYKIADGTESGNLDVTVTAGIRCGGRIYRFNRGTGVEAHGTTQEIASDTTQPVVDVTTLGVKRLACQAMWCQPTTTVTIANITGESGADYTEAVAEFNGTANLMLSLQIATCAAISVITGGSATLGSAETNKITHGFAIKP